MYCLQSILESPSQNLPYLHLLHCFERFHLLHSLLQEGSLDRSPFLSLLRSPYFLYRCLRILIPISTDVMRMKEAVRIRSMLICPTICLLVELVLLEPRMNLI